MQLFLRNHVRNGAGLEATLLEAVTTHASDFAIADPTLEDRRRAVDGRLYVNVTDAAAPRWEDAGMPSEEGRPNLGLGARVVQPQAGREYAPVAMVTDHDAEV
ncbi:hypothetical protein [Sphaerisporangium rhizosphaerae]|uniref:Uncharacterized protein n=1 Tax=Sphaerisporangium rhizosphaerae TaxID=2269375 RepID=A0ABW2PEH1_9ACTN